MVIWYESGGGPGYLLVQEWAVLLLSLALVAIRKFMVTELQWLTLASQNNDHFDILDVGEEKPSRGRKRAKKAPSYLNHQRKKQQ